MKILRLMSSVLAVVMIVSILTVMPVSAEILTIDGPYDFEDVVTTDSYRDPGHATGTVENPVADDSYVGRFLKSTRTTDSDTKTYLDLYTFQSGENNSDYANAAGNVIAIRTNTNWYLLDNITTDFGVETYEFDFFWGHSSSSDMIIKCQDNNTALLPGGKINSKGNSTWKHMKIEYDTVADTLTLYVDDVKINTLEEVETFDKPLLLTNNTGIGLGSRARVFRMDNYASYVTYEPGASLSNLDITMADDSEIMLPGSTGAEGIEIKVTVDAINTYTSDSDVVFVCALYNDDELVDMASKVVTIPALMFDAKELSAEFTTETDVEYDTVKAFIWDGVDTAVSQTASVSYEAE